MQGRLGYSDCALCVLVQIREYEQVIIEDRLEKEKMRKKKQQDDLELKSIVKVARMLGWLGLAWRLDTVQVRGEEMSNGSKVSFQP